MSFYRLTHSRAVPPDQRFLRRILWQFATKALCAILLTAALPAPLFAKFAFKDNYAFEQRSKFVGNFYVQWSRKKLIATSRNGNLSIFADLPDGKLRIYNKETHRCYLSNLSQFTGSYARNLTLLNGFNLDGGKWHKVGCEWIFDLPCARFRPGLDSFDETTAMRQQGVLMADYWAGSGEAIPPNFGLFLAKLFDTPYAGGFPMKLIVHTKHLSNLTIFNTAKAYGPKTFIEPKTSDFTMVSSENQVMLRAFDPENVRPFGSSH